MAALRRHPATGFGFEGVLALKALALKVLALKLLTGMEPCQNENGQLTKNVSCPFAGTRAG
jgi:hypothetical protein